MTTKDTVLENANKFFERRVIDDQRLSEIIPELIEIISQLYEIRSSEEKTRGLIERWRKTKYSQTKIVRLPDGSSVEADISDPDMRLHNLFTGYLFNFFHKQYSQKSTKTTGFAFALEILTQIENSKKGKIFYHELPNTDIDDVFDAIEKETIINRNESHSISNNTSKTTTNEHPITSKALEFSDLLHHHNKDALMIKIHELLDDTKGKNIAITITALKKLGFISGYKSNNCLFNSMRKEFGDIGSTSGLNNFLNINNKLISNEQLEPIIKILQTV